MILKNLENMMLSLILFIFLLHDVSCMDVYVSQSTGNDRLNCGTQKSPCKGIEHILMNTKQGNLDTIILMDSYHTVVPIRFPENEKKTLVLRSVGGAKPVTMSSESETFLNYGNTTDDIRITLENMDLRNVTLLQEENLNTGVFFTLKDCMVRGMKPLVKTVVAQNQSESSGHLTVDIHSSTVDISGNFIQHLSINPLKINITDSTILSGTLKTKTEINLNIHNTIFKGDKKHQMKNEKIIDISGNLWRASVNLSHIKITGDHSKKTFLNCHFCDINVNKILIRDCQIFQLFQFSDVLSSIDGAEVLNVKSKASFFINLIKSNVSFNVITNILDSHFQTSFFQASQKSVVTFENIIVNNSDANQRLLLSANSEITIQRIKLESYQSSYEAINIGENSNLTINDADFFICEFHFAFFISTNSRVTINKAKFVENEVTVNFLGVLNSYFALYNANFYKNKGLNKIAINNLMVFENGATAILQNVNVTKNNFLTGIKSSSSNLDFNHIHFADNLAFSHGKALIYEGDTSDQSCNISIQNFYVKVINHPGFLNKNAIFSIDIIQSSLILNNVLIDIQDMSYPQVNAVELRFATLNTKVLQNKNHIAYLVKCPPSYNPSGTRKLQADFYSYSLRCIPCSRGTYTLARGSENLKYIDNVGFDVKTWSNGKRRFDERDWGVVRDCTACPPGGNCTFGIKSKGNYFGQIERGSDDETNEVEFIPCPAFYCCSNLQKPCQSITGCNQNRKGTLCGSCEDGFYEGYFNPVCISNNECTVARKKRFWLVYIATAFVLTYVIFFLKDFSYFLAGVMVYLKMKFTKLQKKFMKTRNIERFKKPVRSIYYNGNKIGNDCLIETEKPRRFIFSAVLQITLSFFQIVSLIKLHNQSKSNKTMTRIFDLFNLQIALDEAEVLCPFESMNVIWKYFIKNIVFIICMVSFLVISTILNQILGLFKCKCKSDSKRFEYFAPPEHQRLSFLDKLVVCYVKVLMFGYKNISLFTIISLNCVEVNEDSVLYVSGNIKCYQGWQWAVMLLLILWVIPFPAALVYSYKLLDRGLISEHMFLLNLCFPVLSVYFLLKYRNSKHGGRLVDRHGLKAILYDMFEEPYRVTSVDEYGIPHTMYWWNGWRLYERLIIAMIATFLIEPLLRMCVIAPVMVVLLMLHYHARPYKETMTLLSWLDISSLSCLSFYVVDNMFRSFAYIFDIPLNNPIDKAINVLEIFEAILTPLTVICVFIVTFGLEAVYEFTKNVSKKTT